MFNYEYMKRLVNHMKKKTRKGGMLSHRETAITAFNARKEFKLGIC